MFGLIIDNFKEILFTVILFIAIVLFATRTSEISDSYADGYRTGYEAGYRDGIYDGIKDTEGDNYDDEF